MSILAIAISMMLYLGNEKLSPIEKDQQAIVNDESELELAIIEAFQKRNGYLLEREKR